MRAATLPALAVGIALVTLVAAPVAAQTPPYFTNVTLEAGLDGVPAFRVSVGDLNGDGFPDLFVHLEPTHASGDVLKKQRLYLSEPGALPGERVFVDHTTGSGIWDNRSGNEDGRHSDAAIFGDVDNDGDLDVFTSVYIHDNYTLDIDRNDLLINDGTAHFTLSSNSGLHLEDNWNTPAAVFLDYDNDGNLDLFIGTWYKPASTMNQDHLYKGAGDGSFANVSVAAGIASLDTCVYSVAAFDWDDDGDMDLFAPPYSRTVAPSVGRHWRNNGDGTFTQVEPQTDYDLHRGWAGLPDFPLTLPVSFGTIPRDYDNDGDIDFLELLTHGVGDGDDGNRHSTAVTNVGGVFSWDWGRVSGRDVEDPDTTHHGDHYAGWFDFNGDTLVDFALTESGYGNPRLYLFQQQPDNTFQAVTVASGLNDVNTDGASPGYVTPLDFDRDGDEDLIVTTNQGMRLYRNDVGTDNHWIAIDLRGVGAPGYSNRRAIGARVEVTTGSVTQTQEVYAGNGHEGPMRPLRLYFGLGGAATIDSIRVRWPNTGNTLQELTSIAADQFLTIDEPCEGALDPANLLADRDGDDVVLTWDDPSDPTISFNVYRDGQPDPSLWGGAHATAVTDDDPVTPGIQYRDVDGATGNTWYYLATASNVCGETPLR